MFVPRRALAQWSLEVVNNELSKFEGGNSDDVADADGFWAVDMEGENADLVKQARIEMMNVRRLALEANVVLLAQQVGGLPLCLCLG